MSSVARVKLVIRSRVNVKTQRIRGCVDWSIRCSTERRNGVAIKSMKRVSIVLLIYTNEIRGIVSRWVGSSEYGSCVGYGAARTARTLADSEPPSPRWRWQR